MSESTPATSADGWRTWLSRRLAELRQREDQVFLALALVIGALTGLAVVAFIMLTNVWACGSTQWRCSVAARAVPGRWFTQHRLLAVSLFSNARGSGVPQTKAALFAREGRITLRTVLGKFFCTSATLASGIPLGREGPSVQVGGGIASVLGRLSGCAPSKSRI